MSEPKTIKRQASQILELGSDKPHKTKSIVESRGIEYESVPKS